MELVGARGPVGAAGGEPACSGTAFSPSRRGEGQVADVFLFLFFLTKSRTSLSAVSRTHKPIWVSRRQGEHALSLTPARRSRVRKGAR